MLAIAALELDSSRIVSLIDSGANVNSVLANREETPLSIVAWDGDLNLIKVLLAKGADINAGGALMTPIASAVIGKDTSVLSHLLRNGGSPDCSVPGLTRFKDRTPLMFAVENNRLWAVHLLLESGANANTMDRSGNTALTVAAGLGIEKTMKCILSSRPSEALTDEQKYPVDMRASPDIVWSLLESGSENTPDAREYAHTHEFRELSWVFGNFPEWNFTTTGDSAFSLNFARLLWQSARENDFAGFRQRCMIVGDTSGAQHDRLVEDWLNLFSVFTFIAPTGIEQLPTGEYILSSIAMNRRGDPPDICQYHSLVLYIIKDPSGSWKLDYLTRPRLSEISENQFLRSFLN